jgi:hypothetical protein
MRTLKVLLCRYPIIFALAVPAIAHQSNKERDLTTPRAIRNRPGRCRRWVITGCYRTAVLMTASLRGPYLKLIDWPKGARS